MFESTYLILDLVDRIGIVEGRKRFQKIVHLLKVDGCKAPFKYEYHYYGPYSFQLQAELNDMVNNNFLNQEHTDDTYCYKLTDTGEKFKNLIKEEFSIESQINQALIEAMKSKKTSFLEVVSTYAYLMDMGYSDEDAAGKCKELKPHLEYALQEATDFYKKFFVHK